jgi:hypothetical protein
MEPAGRFLLFWLVCVPLRVGLAIATLLVARLEPERMPFLAAGLLLPAAGFAAQLCPGAQRHKGAFGGPAWWADARAVHAALYFAAAALSFWTSEAAGLVLLADVALGATLAYKLQPRP